MARENFLECKAEGGSAYVFAFVTGAQRRSWKEDP